MQTRYRGRGVARKRRGEGLLDVLMASPWQVSAGLAVVVFVGMKWLFPAMAAGNIYLKTMASGLSQIAWLFGGFFLLLAGIRYFQTTSARQPTAQSQEHPHDPPPPAKPTAWSIELLRAIEWKRFEDVCQKIYELKGIRSETTPLGPDGGIDIRLYQDDSGKPTTIVQCKAWGERYVGVKPVRELLGVMTHEKIAKAFFMTPGYYSDEAKEVAKSNHITLMDGDLLLMMIQRLPEPARAQLLAFATEGDYATPTCPTCGSKMKTFPGKNGRPDFWGCPNYPKCRQKPLTKRAEGKAARQ